MKYLARLIPLLVLIAVIRKASRVAAEHCHEAQEHTAGEPTGVTL